VTKDIRKIILGIDADKFDEAQTVLGGDTNIVRAFVNRQGEVYGVDRTLYRPDATLETLAEFHQKNRLANGRTTDAGTFTRDIGRWKFITKLIVPKDVLTEYIEVVKARVGRGKGGWAAGVIALGGEVPGWIEVHARTAGTFIDKTQDANPEMEFVNRSEWAEGGDQDRIIDNAIKARTRDIYRQIQLALKEAAEPMFGL
jgi:hypothetical protein